MYRLYLCLATTILFHKTLSFSCNESCSCGRRVGLDHECIRNTITCEDQLYPCHENIQTFFKLNFVQHPYEWLEIYLHNGTLIVNLSRTAQHQLQFLPNSSINVNLESLSAHPQQCYIKEGPETHEWNFKNATIERDMLSLEKPSIVLENKLQPPTALKIQVVLLGEEQQEIILWPSALKSVNPPTVPGAMSPNHLTVFVYFYGELSDIQMFWQCPSHWNSYPVGYNVQCLTFLARPALNSKLDEHCWEEIENNEIILTEDECWTPLFNMADQSHWFAVPWHQNHLSFEVKSNKTPEVVCHLRAQNSMGFGHWTPPCKGIDGIPNIVHGLMIKDSTNGDTRWKSISFDFDPHQYESDTSTNTSYGRPHLSSFRHNKTVTRTIKSHLKSTGCYDWIADVWYVFATKHEGTKWLVVVKDEESVNNPDFLIQLNGEPGSLVCFPDHATVVWSVKQAENNIALHKFNVKNGTDTLIGVQSSCDCPPWNQSLQSTLLARNISDSNQMELIVITEFGIWATALDDCKCMEILEFGNHRVQFHTTQRTELDYLYVEPATSKMVTLDADKIKSIGTYVYVDSESMLEFALIMNDNGTNHLVRVRKWNQSTNLQTYPVIPIMKRLSDNDMDKYPIFASHIRSFEAVSQPVRVWSHKVPQQAPPAKCMFPEISSLQSEMISEHLAKVTVTTDWNANEAQECISYSKPKIVIRLRYFETETRVQTSYCTENCSCDKNPHCTAILTKPSHTGILSRNIAVETFSNYRLEVSAIPDLGNYGKLWYGDRKGTSRVHFFSSYFKKPQLELILIATSAVFVVALITLIALLCYMYRKKWYIYRHIKRLLAQQIKYQDKDKLGEGNFAQVYKASVLARQQCCHSCTSKPTVICVAAVKILKLNVTERAKSSFLEEAILLSELHHRNIIRPIGICMDSRPIMLALEFMNGGGLNSYLHKEDTRERIKPNHQLKMLLDIARACIYLEKKGIVHRDLSAKNCLVRLDSRQMPSSVKLGDFGLAKDTRSMHERIYNTDNLVFPVAFTAPEGFGGKFSSKSDVWSFGVVVWEVFSWGAHPFGPCPVGYSHSCEVEALTSGAEIRYFVCVRKLALNNRPDPCTAVFPPCIRRIMDFCWLHEANDRPTFVQIMHDLVECKRHIAIQYEAQGQCEDANPVVFGDNFYGEESNEESSSSSGSQETHTTDGKTNDFDLKCFY